MSGGSGSGGIEKVLEVSVTRPANTTQYAIGGILAPSGSDSNSTLVIQGLYKAGASGFILNSEMIQNNNPGTKPSFRCHVYGGYVTINTDGTVYNPGIGDYESFLICAFDYLAASAIVPVTGDTVVRYPGVMDRTPPAPFKNQNLDTNLFVVITALNTYTPTSGEIFKFHFGISMS